MWPLSILQMVQLWWESLLYRPLEKLLVSENKKYPYVIVNLSYCLVNINIDAIPFWNRSVVILPGYIISVGSSLEPPTVSVSQGPLTTTTTVATTSTEVPCIDYEPYLCDIAWYEWLCDTRFGQSQCCWTCYVPKPCRDLVEGCHKIPLYGLCDNPRYQQDCCASCVYVEPWHHTLIFF